MIQNYFKTAWRNLKAGKLYSIINILGIAIGLTTAILLFLWVQEEKSFDKFHSKADNIYRLSASFPANGETITWSGVPGPLAVYTKAIPDVMGVVRINDDWGESLKAVKESKTITGIHGGIVDSSFFNLFNFKLIDGNKLKPFSNVNEIIITKATAEKLFADKNAIGQTVKYLDDVFNVSGVLENFPANSSINFDLILPMDYYAKKFAEQGGNGNWKTIDADLGNYTFQTFLLLRNDANPTAVGEALSEAYRKARDGKSEKLFNLQPLKTIHLVKPDGDNAAQRRVNIFLFIAVLILVIAAINYINLSTARAAGRMKEVGVRKVVGASRKQLIGQFAVDAVLIYLIATILALILLVLLLPSYRNLTDRNIELFHSFTPWIIISVTLLGSILISGIYPSFLLSSFKPAVVLKGKLNAGAGGSLFRKILVVVQFSISILLIIGTIVITRQMNFMRDKDLGYDKNYLFTVNLPYRDNVNYEDLPKILKQNPSITDASISSIYDIMNFGNATGDLDWTGKPANYNMTIGQGYIDENFLPTMKIKLKEGKNFSGTTADSGSYILNEIAIQKMGLKQPVLGQEIKFHDKPGTIVGVVEDFNFKSLKEDIAPLIFSTQHWKGTLYIRTNAAKIKQAIAATENLVKPKMGDAPFSYNFLDQKFDEVYKTEQRMAFLTKFFSIVAILISCLGLFGLTTYAAQMRVKEIGIRKVLGAGIENIVTLLGKDFLWLVGIAIIISVPLSWLAMNKWLQDFAYKISIQPWMLISGGAIAILLAIATISFQAIKAALANPIKSLRSE